jgi:two-component system CheB/CheR fusion protein
LLDKHAPACVVVNAEGDVLYIHGHTGRYLEPPAGEPSGSIHRMAREGLRQELSSGMRKALTQKKPVRCERLRVRTSDGTALVNLIIEPMAGPDAVKGVLLVLFEDVPETPSALGETALEPIADREQRIADLDRELSAKEEYLRTTVEELETTNEELKSTTEEMQSSNEELQSTNEELETSREELQSINEELLTVNSELQQRVEELSRANNDMHNMLAGTGIGTLFLDQKLRIQRFTPAITEIMSLIPTDIGRPLADIAQRLTGGTDVVSAATAVLDTLNSVETQVQTTDGRVYVMRAQPYRTLDNVIEGAVLTFVDVTEQQRLQAAIDEATRAVAEAGEFAQNVLDTVREPQLVLDGELTVVTANKAFMAAFQKDRGEIIGHPLSEVYDGAWLKPDLVELLLEVLPKKKSLGDFKVSLTTGALRRRTVTLNALELLQIPGKRRLMLLTVTDIEGGA